MATSKSLVRANLAIHEPPTGTTVTPGALIRTFAFEFNPAQLSISQRTQWKATPTCRPR
ncbi:LysM peptidoglycan-binding domain-containing protein OS=Streptomyces tendae OX=1932 GN=GUR47_26295 PE=4 SV=1 [Streptomyces tendae]